jgi:hypothetical protein
MKKFIITEEEKNSIRKMYLMEEDETAQADEEIKNIDIKQYCSDRGAPAWVTKILNSLPEDKKQEAIKIIKSFANVVSGKSLKELIALRKEVNDEKRKAELLNKGTMNEQLAPLVIAGISIPATLLIIIGIILVTVIIYFIVRKSSKKGIGCGGPGWWNDL